MDERFRPGQEPVQAGNGGVVSQKIRDVLANPVLGDDLGEREAGAQRIAVGIGVSTHHDLGRVVYERANPAELIALFGKYVLVACVHWTYSASAASSPASESPDSATTG